MLKPSVAELLSAYDGRHTYLDLGRLDTNRVLIFLRASCTQRWRASACPSNPDNMIVDTLINLYTQTFALLISAHPRMRVTAGTSEFSVGIFLMMDNRFALKVVICICASAPRGLTVSVEPFS